LRVWLTLAGGKLKVFTSYSRKDEDPSMPVRWNMLVLLFAVRTVMAFQFQSVAALAPFLKQEFSVDLADIGLLIGLYLAPGIVLAVPGGAIGNRFGDKNAVLAGIMLMILGSLTMAFSSSWSMQIAGRLLGGVGGVLLNVLMSKMVTDWFADREIATAMGIFVNSWIVGIAMALLVLPPTEISLGISAAFLLVTILVVIGFAALATYYRAPPKSRQVGSRADAKPMGAALLAIILAGLIWGLFNMSVGMIFSFGTSMLAERGWSVGSASSIASMTLWLTALSVPLGGFLADRTGWRCSVLIGGLLSFAIMLLVAARAESVIPAFIALGLVCGLPAGPIMSLPARVLNSDTRAVGMGIFFTLFYVCIVVGPWLGGYVAKTVGNTRAAFDLGAIILVACCGVTFVHQLAANYAQRSGTRDKSSRVNS
jgi:MFS family permease